MSRPYQLHAADRCGVFREERFENFQAALGAYRTWRDELDPINSATNKRSGGVAFRISNIEQADVDSDGLTEEEREESP